VIGDGSSDSDNLDLIARPGQEARVAAAILDWLSAQRSEWDLLELGSVDSASPSLRALRDELDARGWKQTLRQSAHPVIELGDSWDAYLASLSSTTRAGLRRKLRDLDKHRAVRLRRCEREAELPGLLEHLYRMHADRWQGRGQSGSFALGARREFYASIASRFLAAGWLSFWVLELDGEVVAAEFGFRHGSTHSFLQGGFDPKHSHLSVGAVLKCHILQQLIADGVRRYDFLGGEDAYKLRWAPTMLTHAHLRCARPRSAGAASLDLERLGARAKAWVLGRLPQPLARPLRAGYRRLWPLREGIIEAEAS